MSRPELWMDSENGGLDAKIHSPLSFAFLAVKENRIVDKLRIEIRQEPFVLTIEAMKVNKIDITTPGVDFRKAKELYMDFMNRNFYTTVIDRGQKTERRAYVKPDRNNMPLFCGHNTFYDRPWLQRIVGEFDYCYYHRWDTMIALNMAAKMGRLEGLKSFSQEVVSDYLGFPKTNFHDSMADIERCYEISQKLVEIMNGKSVDQVRAEVAVQPSLFTGLEYARREGAMAAQAH